MSRNFNTKILLIVFVVLLAGYFLVKLVGKRSGGGTFPELVVELDTTGIDKIVINPKAEKGDALEFALVDGSWRVRKGEKDIPATDGVVETMIQQLSGLKPTRLATRNKENWSQYDATDSAGTRVRVYSGDEERADVVIGRISYKQISPQQMQYGGGGNNVEGSSFVRLSDEDEVYTVEGFLSFTFNRDFNSFRNRIFTSLNQDSITRLEFVYPADSGFTVQRTDSLWAIGRLPVDQEAFKKYLGQISNKNFSNFNDEFKKGVPPVYQLIISESGKPALTIQAFDLGNGKWVLNSSSNPEGMFEESMETVFGLFPSQKQF